MTVWIQIAISVVMAGISVWTLVVLIRYAGDTKRISNLAADQLEKSLIPFLAIIDAPTHAGDHDYVIRNQGNGPALNIRYFQGIPGTQPWIDFFSSIAQSSADIRIRDLCPNWEPIHGFTMRYDSLSGRHYETIMRIRIPGYQFVMQFAEIPGNVEELPNPEIDFAYSLPNNQTDNEYDDY